MAHPISRYEVVKVWANWDIERSQSTLSFYSNYEHACIECNERNNNRSGIFFHSFVVKDRLHHDRNNINSRCATAILGCCATHCSP